MNEGSGGNATSLVRIAMKQEINPQETNRREAFELWMKSPNPMVTLTKTFDVTRMERMGRRKGLKFNVLLCWCIGKAASEMKEFYLLPIQGKLFQFDRLGINVIVNNRKGGISLCDVPFSDDLEQFNADYVALTESSSHSCENVVLDDVMVIGTSAMTATELDSVTNQYSGIYNNPFLAWGKIRKSWLKTTLPLSFQFHHSQMDGGHAARFLENLQKTMKTI